jgi:hypothetical protein
MKTVEITTAFTGYPNDKKRHFAKGEEPELANDFADMIIGKGLAREKPAAPAKPAASPAKAKDDK